jgi:hypothetical protein
MQNIIRGCNTKSSSKRKNNLVLERHFLLKRGREFCFLFCFLKKTCLLFHVLGTLKNGKLKRKLIVLPLFA